MQAINDLKAISGWVAHEIHQVQGAGGNTSVKDDNGHLWIKASGKTMQDVINQNCYLAVDNARIYNALTNVQFDITSNDHTQQFIDTVKDAVVNSANKSWQPSMETGFHTLFYKYTVHTHNAWSNVFFCSDKFYEIEVLFADITTFTLSSLTNYYTPGVPLSWHIFDTFRFEEEMPNVLFLPNHGIIYSHNDLDQLKKIIKVVDDTIFSYLKVKATDYPAYTLAQESECIIVECDFLINNFLEKEHCKIFTELLFPDQAIYINKDEFSFTEKERIFNVSHAEKRIKSKGTVVQTKAVIETAIAFYFIWQQCAFRGFEPLTINWEWEALTKMPTEQHRIKMMNS